MADSYLAISQIANDASMRERMNAAATQQAQLNTVHLRPDALSWVMNNRYRWAASPGWGEAWAYALNTHSDTPDYDPGKDEGVITDAMILAAVQELGNGTFTVHDLEPTP